MLTTILAAFLAMSSDANSVLLQREFQGIRSAAMGGAHRGVGTSNDTIALNPAGLAIAQRYSFDAEYGYSPLDGLSRMKLSAVDSKSAPVAAAVQYALDIGNKHNIDTALHRLYFGVAYPLADFLSFGMVSKAIYGKFNNSSGKKIEVADYSVDFGLSACIAKFVGLGFTYHNLVRESRAVLLRPALGFGTSMNIMGLVAAFDLRMDLDNSNPRYFSYHAGGEYFIQNTVALRAGYLRQPTVAQSAINDRITAGIAFVDNAGALDFTYVQSVQNKSDWQLITALKLYL
jgi:hypothetical protein